MTCYWQGWKGGGRFILSGVWFTVFALLLLDGWNLAAQPPVSKEYQVKAVFLFNFSQFVDWPTNAFPEKQTPLVIGVLGENPFGAYLDEIVRGETVNNHPLLIEHYSRLEDIKRCQILFVSRSETRQLDLILENLKGRSILTVGDIEGFAKRGGMIQFVTKKNKIRLQINLEAAKAAGLTISSKLLRLAEIITPEKNWP